MPVPRELAKSQRILIVGGGLAGLAVTEYLRKYGFQPTIVERATSWQDQGYAIGFWEPGIKVLKDLNALEQVRSAGVIPDQFDIRATGGDLVCKTTFSPESLPVLLVSRADLHAALRQRVPRDTIEMDTAPAAIHECENCVEVTFNDGSTQRFDVVIGADGVHSAVRKKRFPDAECRLRDSFVWSMWVSNDRITVDIPMTSIWGPGVEAFIADLGSRTVVNLVARLSSCPDQSVDSKLQAAAESIGWHLPQLVRYAEEKPFFDRIREVSCPRWHTDRVVLIGDAAHAVTPIAGMGASLALRDAKVLATELGANKRTDVKSTLSQFETRRRSIVRRKKIEAMIESRLALLSSKPLRWFRNTLTSKLPVFRVYTALFKDVDL